MSRLASAELNNAAVDAALATLPVDDSGLSDLADIKENMDRHGEGKIAHADINSPVSHSVVGNFIHKKRQAHSGPFRSCPPERFGSRASRRASVQSLLRVTNFVIDEQTGAAA